MSIADDLRTWRLRRKVSQIELALRAGTTQRHVSFIESGRSTPGRTMVIRLAESLDVPLRERNALLLTAGYAPAYPETPWDDTRLSPVRAAVEQVISAHNPYPAIVVDRHGTLVSANSAFHTLTSDVAPDLREPPVNIPRLLLHPRGLAPQIINFDEWSCHVVDALRAQAARTPDPTLDALITELADYAPARPVSPAHLGFASPLRLRTQAGELHLLTTLTHFATALDVTVAELRLEAFLPADERTAALLQAGDKQKKSR
ncbi:transcriptional regulator with XRE-family HTH domain [Actinokineospora baliensis]|uniref:helix-turn-helix domain-containing protein n=1 Tax=Actinokineospora baliensis TaxID=547056 RepID=UPI001958620E|nr:helix-turn-helix domain-containing protein [Actinokineospora baliensis]MBM7774339.1 transcriptional regulator with XRE-family HTH domain [Actinokineospora baliensis]